MNSRQKIYCIESWRPGIRSDDRTDCFIGTLGYETRARHFAERTSLRAAKRVAIGFTDRQVLAYGDNKTWYRQSGYEVLEPTEAEFPGLVRKLLHDLQPSGSDSLSICIDISSLSRARMAAWVNAIVESQGNVPIVTRFVYSAAKYSPPPPIVAPNRNVDALPGFVGWSDPSLPTTAVVGVGYEHNKALGAVEYIDPEKIWAFVPAGHHRSYTRQISMANAALWDRVPAGRRVSYDVKRPFDTFSMLESFANGALRSSNLIILPFGPKVFALVALVTACAHTDVAVWRVSSGQVGPAVDRLPNGSFYGLQVTFRPSLLGNAEQPVGCKAESAASDGNQ